LVAEVFQNLGVYMGSETNGSHDNLWFTMLFRRKDILDIDADEFEHRLDIFASAMTGSRALGEEDKNYLAGLVADLKPKRREWAKKRANSLLDKPEALPSQSLWGWKEPNTHIVLKRLLQLHPGLKYIHVMRNGLDMAYSNNQNQPRFWHGHLNQHRRTVSPEESLHFWCRTHEKILEMSKTFPDAIKLVRLEDICSNPDTEIAEMAAHSGLSPSPTEIGRLTKLVKRPESIGRFRNHSLSGFAQDDLRFVRQMGYDSGE